MPGRLPRQPERHALHRSSLAASPERIRRATTPTGRRSPCARPNPRIHSRAGVITFVMSAPHTTGRLFVLTLPVG